MMAQPERRQVVPRATLAALRVGGLVIAAAATAAILAWGAGRLLSDRWAWSQWLLWIPTPAALVAALAGLVAAARPGPVRGRRLATWGAVLVLLLGFFLFVEHRFHRGGAPPSAGVTVVHWNINYAKDSTAALLARPVIETPADVTILSNAGAVVADEALRGWLDESDRRLMIMGPFTVITALPVIERRVVVAAEGIRVTLLTLDAPGVLPRPISIWMVDLPSAPALGRMALADRARRLLELGYAFPPDLMIGDFNITRGSAALSRLAPGYRHAFDVAGRGYGASFARPVPLYHIDHVLVAPGIEVAAYDLLDPGHRHHLMQRAVITGVAP